MCLKTSTLQGIKIINSTFKGLPIERNKVTTLNFLNISESNIIVLYNDTMYLLSKPKNWIDSKTLGERNILLSKYGKDSVTMIEVF